MSTDRVPLAILPHRAYRRLTALRPASVGFLCLVLAAFELVLLAYLGDLARLFSGLALALTTKTGVSVTVGEDFFLGVRLSPLLFSASPMDYTSILGWVLGCGAGIAVLSVTRWMTAPLRVLLIYNLFLIGTTAVYLLYTGQLGYDAETFSRLYVRTVVIVWATLPLFMGMLSAILPFSSLEQAGFVVSALTYNFVFSALRYAFFVWAISRIGIVVMPDLYLFFGPFMDFVYSVGIFTLFLGRLRRRLDRHGERWVWL